MLTPNSDSGTLKMLQILCLVSNWEAKSTSFPTESGLCDFTTRESNTDVSDSRAQEIDHRHFLLLEDLLLDMWTII